MNSRKRSVFAARLVEARKAKGWSQIRLANALDMNQQSVAFWEVDRCRPKFEALPKIARLLGVSLDWLMGVDAEVEG